MLLMCQENFIIRCKQLDCIVEEKLANVVYNLNKADVFIHTRLKIFI